MVYMLYCSHYINDQIGLDSSEKYCCTRTHLALKFLDDVLQLQGEKKEVKENPHKKNRRQQTKQIIHQALIPVYQKIAKYSSL